MPDSIQTIIDRVRSGTGTTAMEYTEYRVDVLALCNFAEQAQVDLARVTAERDKEHATATKALEIYTMAEDEGDALRARVAELEATIAELTTDGNAATLAANLAKASKRNAELVEQLKAYGKYAHDTTLEDQNAELVVALREEKRIHPQDFLPGDFRERALARAESATPAKQEVKP